MFERLPLELAWGTRFQSKLMQSEPHHQFHSFPEDESLNRDVSVEIEQADRSLHVPGMEITVFSEFEPTCSH